MNVIGTTVCVGDEYEEKKNVSKWWVWNFQKALFSLSFSVQKATYIFAGEMGRASLNDLVQSQVI